MELAAESLRLLDVFSSASGVFPRVGMWPATSSSQCAASSYIGAGAADVLPLDAFFRVRLPVLDSLEPPSSVPAEEGGAGCRASSALLTREGRRRVGGAVPSNEVS